MFKRIFFCISLLFVFTIKLCCQNIPIEEYWEKYINAFNNNNYSEALKFLEPLANLGVPIAQNDMGFFYENGFVVEKNYDKAAMWYTKSAMQGNEMGQYNLGRYYQSKEDYSQAFNWFMRSAQNGYSDAQNSLGSMYMNGEGREINYSEAYYWFIKSSEQNNKYAQYNLGALYARGKVGLNDSPQWPQAVRYYMLSANNGYGRAYTELGYCYERGLGVEKSFMLAFEYYKKAADSGDIMGTYNLGTCFENGMGTEVNIKEAIKYYKIASQGGNVNAINNLALLEKNKEKAFEMFLTAAQKGSAPAQANVAALFIKGDGCEKDFEEGRKWAEKSALNGVDRGQYILSICMIQGIGGPVDIKKSVYWAKKSSDQGYPEGEFLYGQMCFDFLYSHHVIELENQQRGIDSYNSLNIIEKGKKLTLSAYQKGVKRAKKYLYKDSFRKDFIPAIKDYSHDFTEDDIEEKRNAIVLGNCNYKYSSSLSTALNDASAVKMKLKNRGFNVTFFSNIKTRNELLDSISNVASKISKSDVLLFYYSGHALEYNNDKLRECYLEPTFSDVRTIQNVSSECVGLSEILKILDSSCSKKIILMIDACRDSPNIYINNELSNMNVPENVYVIFSCQPRSYAVDQADFDLSRHSPFANSVLETLDIPLLSIVDFFDQVKTAVSTRTNGHQIPESIGGIGDFVFSPK